MLIKYCLCSVPPNHHILQAGDTTHLSYIHRHSHFIWIREGPLDDYKSGEGINHSIIIYSRRVAEVEIIEGCKSEPGVFSEGVQVSVFHGR